MRGAGIGGEFAKSSGAFFFVWTLLALGVTATFSVILSVRGLWSLQWGPAPVVQQPEHGKARRTVQVIGADRVLALDGAETSQA